MAGTVLVCGANQPLTTHGSCLAQTHERGMKHTCVGPCAQSHLMLCSWLSRGRMAWDMNCQSGTFCISTFPLVAVVRTRQQRCVRAYTNLQDQVIRSSG